MFIKNKKVFRLCSREAQSTAEYAIVLGLVVAVVAGVLQVALKGGIKKKNLEAFDVLNSTTLKNSDGTNYTGSGSQKLYNQDWRQTTISENTDKSVLSKGGKEERKTTQKSTSEAVSVETLNAVN